MCVCERGLRFRCASFNLCNQVVNMSHCGFIAQGFRKDPIRKGVLLNIYVCVCVCMLGLYRYIVACAHLGNGTGSRTATLADPLILTSCH